MSSETTTGLLDVRGPGRDVDDAALAGASRGLGGRAWNSARKVERFQSRTPRRDSIQCPLREVAASMAREARVSIVAAVLNDHLNWRDFLLAVAATSVVVVLLATVRFVSMSDNVFTAFVLVVSSTACSAVLECRRKARVAKSRRL